MLDPKVPYNNLPELPPSFIFEDVDLLKKVNRANKAISQLSDALHKNLVHFLNSFQDPLEALIKEQRQEIDGLQKKLISVLMPPVPA